MVSAVPESQRGERGGTVHTLLAQPGAGGPTVLRIMLGAQLRRLREARRISRQEAGDLIRASQSKMSRMEAGRVGFKARDIADLLGLYGVTDQRERDTLQALAQRANAPGWWHDYSDILPAWFEAYVGLEEAATQIRSSEMQFVPGLLQTGGYARAVTLLGHDDASAEEVERRVRLRLARQALLTRPDPPHVWAVLDEAVLRRQVGDAKVMRGQLRSLIEATEMPNVTLQVIPFEAGGLPATAGTFGVLRFAEADLPDVVYLEQLTSSLYLDKREAVDHYQAVLERLCQLASPPRESARAVEAILKQMY